MPLFDKVAKLVRSYKRHCLQMASSKEEPNKFEEASKINYDELVNLLPNMPEFKDENSSCKTRKVNQPSRRHSKSQASYAKSSSVASSFQESGSGVSSSIVSDKTPVSNLSDI